MFCCSDGCGAGISGDFDAIESFAFDNDDDDDDDNGDDIMFACDRERERGRDTANTQNNNKINYKR